MFNVRIHWIQLVLKEPGPHQPGRLALNLAPFGRTCPIHTKVICGHDNILVAKIIFDPSCKSRHFDTNVTLLWKCRDKIVTPI